MGTTTHNPGIHEFINCEFEYECPKNWFDLKETGKAGIKHCNACNQDVHLCVNQEELTYAITQKFCIAYFRNPTLQTRFKLSREKCEANKINPKFLRRATLGLPKGAYSGIDKLFVSITYKDDDENS